MKCYLYIPQYLQVCKRTFKKLFMVIQGYYHTDSPPTPVTHTHTFRIQRAAPYQNMIASRSTDVIIQTLFEILKIKHMYNNERKHTVERQTKPKISSITNIYLLWI